METETEAYKNRMAEMAIQTMKEQTVHMGTSPIK
jgi:hypothetical protein